MRQRIEWNRLPSARALRLRLAHEEGMIRARGVVRVGKGDSIAPVAVSQSIAILFDVGFEGATVGARQPVIAAVDSSADVLLDF